MRNVGIEQPWEHNKIMHETVKKEDVRKYFNYVRVVDDEKRMTKDIVYAGNMHPL